MAIVGVGEFATSWLMGKTRGLEIAGWIVAALACRWLARRIWKRPGNGWWVIATAAGACAGIEALTGGAWRAVGLRFLGTALALALAAPWHWNKILDNNTQG